MTPRNRWQHRWVRETLIPLIWLLAVCILLGAALGTSIAHSAPASAGELYAQEHAADICITLDAHPTVSGVAGVALALRDTGLDDYAIGEALADSVLYVCPIHRTLLQQFANHYKKGRAA